MNSWLIWKKMLRMPRYLCDGEETLFSSNMGSMAFGFPASLAGQLIYPNFADFAKSCGGDGFRVERPEELDSALEQAFSSNKPAIVDVVIDKDKMAMPVITTKT